jgi:hypothetical protein
MISLWLGFQARMILFGVWLSACVSIAVLLMTTAFGDIAVSRAGIILLIALTIFQCAAFGMGFLGLRARNARSAE